MYIIIRGPLGIGKTAIAKKLKNKLKAIYISIDSVLEKHNLDKVEEEGISLKNFIKGNELILPYIKEKLSKGKIVIIDGCFYHKEQIKHFIKNLSHPYHVFTLKAPLRICIERDSKRKRVYGKQAAITVFNLVNKFDYGTVVDTEDKTIEKTIKKIVSYLSKSKRKDI